jgi:hypothetical protein
VLRAGCAVLVGGLIWSGCSSGDATSKKSGAQPTSKKPGATSTAAPTATPTATPTRFDFTPDPKRAPKTPADGLRIARAVAAGPESFGPGHVRGTPYESDPARWAVLDEDCVWQRAPLPAGVLASLTHYIELPAEGAKGPMRFAATVTVHRDVSGADWELARTLEEALRCPDQQLSQGEKLTGLISRGVVFGSGANGYAEDTVAESGEYRSDALGGPHFYYWDQSRIGQVTTAVVGKAAKGRGQQEMHAGMQQAIGVMLNRVEEELEATE